MATIDNILSPVWTLSLDGGGAVAEGIEAIKQCLNVIVRTTPGTDPLRPEFGCNMSKYADQPLNVAIPNMKKVMLEAVGRWEPRVKISRITHRLGDTDKGQIIFNLGYALVDGTVTDSLTVSVGSGGISTGTTRQRIIIRAYLPVSGTGLQYQVSGKINGTGILPAPPTGGFASLADLYAWVQNNWTNYGQWYLTGDSLVGYLNPTYTSGSLSVSLLSVRQISTPIPSGFNYRITVDVDGMLYSNTIEINTPGGILQYLNSDPILGQLGTWRIVNIPSSFNGDFGEDYDIYTQVLQLITDAKGTIQFLIAAN